MRHLLRGIGQHFYERDVDDRKLTEYVSMRQHVGWGTHREMLLTLRGMIATELLSDRFTKLDATEKDVQQRAYSHVNELINFLLNPLDLATRRAQFKREFDKLTRGATAMGTTHKPGATR